MAGMPHGVAVSVPTRDGVGLVEQAVADFACAVRAKTVKVGFESGELLGLCQLAGVLIVMPWQGRG